MKSGKLPNKILSALLKHVDINDPRVKVGPQVGEDAAAIDIGDKYLLVKKGIEVTLSPTWNFVTFFPTASTIPLASDPIRDGNSGIV